MAAACKVSIAMAAAVAVIAAGARASAQAIGAPPDLPVEISAGQPGTTIMVRGPQGEVACGERCGLTLPLGTYKMIVKDRDGYLSTQKLDVTMATRATVTPPEHATRILGITSGVVGLAAAAAGAITLCLALFVRAVERIDCGGMECQTDDVPSWTWYAGGISLGAGLALGVTGLVLWRQNAHATVRLDASVPPPATGGLLRLAPVAGRQWAGMGLTARF